MASKSEGQRVDIGYTIVIRIKIAKMKVVVLELIIMLLLDLKVLLVLMEIIHNG